MEDRPDEFKNYFRFLSKKEIFRMVRQVGVKNENHNDRAIIEMTHHT